MEVSPPVTPERRKVVDSVTPQTQASSVAATPPRPPLSRLESVKSFRTASRLARADGVFFALPKQIYLSTLRFLNMKDLVRFAGTDKRCRYLAEHDGVWRDLYKRRFKKDPPRSRSRSIKALYKKRLGSPSVDDRIQVAWNGHFNLVSGGFMTAYEGNAWWDAVVLAKRAEVDGTRYHVSYMSWPGSWNEWVPRSRLRWAPRIPRRVAACPGLVAAAWGGHEIDLEDDSEIVLPSAARAVDSSPGAAGAASSLRGGAGDAAGVGDVGAYRAGDKVELRCISTHGPSPWLEAVVIRYSDRGVHLADCVVIGAGTHCVVPPERLRLVDRADADDETDDAGCCSMFGTAGEPAEAGGAGASVAVGGAQESDDADGGAGCVIS